MRVITIALLMVFSLSSWAQLVGVKEKNSYYLGYRGGASFSLVNQVTTHPMFSSEENKDWGIRYNVYPRVDYVFALTNKFSLQAHGSLGTTSRNNSESGGVYDEDRFISYDYEIGTPKYTDRKFGIQLNWHLRHKGALAPIGSYFGIGFSRRSTKATHNNMMFRSYQQNAPLLDISDVEFNYISNRLNMQFGSREMLSRRLFYDMALDIGFNYRTISDGFGDTYDPTLDGQVQETLEERLRESYLIRDVLTINLGLGYILH